MKSTFNCMFSRDISDQGCSHVAGWELRPGGMLVQKRDSYANDNSASASTSTVKVKVKYGSSYHEIRISSHASFGELKKMLAEPTGLHPQDQKLIFKNKVRDSKSYLDEVRVKDASKMVLLEDIESRERRTLETLKIAKKEKTSKSLKEINWEFDRLAKKVAALEGAASTGGIIAEMDVEKLTEDLIRILIKLDEISAEGDLKLQRREQVIRVQKHIETLDMLKMPNSVSRKKEDNMPMESQAYSVFQKQEIQRRQGNTVAERIPKQQQPLKHSESAVVTTKWETFDLGMKIEDFKKNATQIEECIQYG